MTISAHAYPDAAAAPPAAVPTGWRSLWRLLRRRRWPAAVAGGLAAALILALGPFLPRTYRAAATLERDERPLVDPAGNQPWIDTSAGAKSLEADLRAALGSMVPPERLAVRTETVGPGQQRVALTLWADEPDKAYVALKTAVDRYLATSRARTADALEQAGAALKARQEEAAKAVQAAEQKVQAFQVAHPGVLPEDPNSVVNRLQRTVSKLEDRQQRSKVLEEQIIRLEAYGKRVKSGAAAPVPVTQPAAASGAVAAGPAGQDPEVLALRAQLNLLNEQLEEQVTTLRRTEQHPYVVDLRARQAAMQKKLEAAQARAAAGKPPPPVPEGYKPPPDNARDLALQTIELQLQQLKSERDAVSGEIAALTEQRDKEQTQVEGLLPLRREWAGLNDQLKAAQQARGAVQEKLGRFAERFGEDPRKQAQVVTASVEAAGRVPVRPRFDFVVLAAVVAGSLAGLGAAYGAQRLDGTYGSAGHFRAATGAPVLVVIDEIVTPPQQRRRAIGRWAGKPALGLGLAVVVLGAAGFCYSGIHQPAFQRLASERGLWSAITAPSQ